MSLLPPPLIPLVPPAAAAAAAVNIVKVSVVKLIWDVRSFRPAWLPEMRLWTASNRSAVKEPKANSQKSDPAEQDWDRVAVCGRKMSFIGNECPTRFSSLRLPVAGRHKSILVTAWWPCQCVCVNIRLTLAIWLLAIQFLTLCTHRGVRKKMHWVRVKEKECQQLHEHSIARTQYLCKYSFCRKYFHN